MKVLVAGASGAIGRPLVKRLVEAGHAVTGLSRTEHGLTRLRGIGAEAIGVDALDQDAIRNAVRSVAPEIVIDQLTSLPADPAKLNDAGPGDRNLRRVGGGHLYAAAQAFGVRRYLQQSCGFLLRATAELADEASELRLDGPEGVGDNSRMYADLEARCFSSQTMEGVALRVGFFYGEGTWYWPDGGAASAARTAGLPIVGAGDATWSFVHVDDAAAATVSAMTAAAGTYVITDDTPVPVNTWLPAFARWVGGPEPTRIEGSAGLQAAGAVARYYHHNLSGATNVKAKAELEFAPRRLAWLDD